MCDEQRGPDAPGFKVKSKYLLNMNFKVVSMRTMVYKQNKENIFSLVYDAYYLKFLKILKKKNI